MALIRKCEVDYLPVSKVQNNKGEADIGKAKGQNYVWGSRKSRKRMKTFALEQRGYLSFPGTGSGKTHLSAKRIRTFGTGRTGGIASHSSLPLELVDWMFSSLS